MNQIMTPFTVKYHGRRADDHVLDAIELGHSLQGTARIYNSIAHYVAYGEVLKPRQKQLVRCYAKIPREGSYEAILVMASVATEYEMFNKVYQYATDWLVAKIGKHVKDALTGNADTEKLIAVIQQQAAQDEKIMEVLSHGLVKANDRIANLHGKLIDTLPQLVETTIYPAKDMVAPFGNSCDRMTLFDCTDEAFSITEPDAVVIRSSLDLKVGDMQNYLCTNIFELHLGTGACKLVVDGFQSSINGKISDPAINESNNIYSRHLNDRTGFRFTAKPVMKEGDVHKLFISDAREL